MLQFLSENVEGTKPSHTESWLRKIHCGQLPKTRVLTLVYMAGPSNHTADCAGGPRKGKRPGPASFLSVSVFPEPRTKKKKAINRQGSDVEPGDSWP